ncbi:ATP-binding cassette domain-containing protein, partial [bacterium]|nr:ATP-binding cassette domain-containing protein [candidate division CSSED10-310 bacterium]
SAKTTLVNLIGRCYDPPPGALFVDGRDVRQWRLRSLRSQVSYVPQQAFLFSDTIAGNIAFGTDMTDTEILAAAEAAGLGSEVNEFAAGYETLVGERGVTLSGGQKQRVTIARALARKSPVLILDDALSAVDSETEEAIVTALEEWCRDTTVIIISHRVSIARKADQIIYLEDGAIVERGSHAELAALGGRYSEIYKYQKLLEELERIDAEEMTGELVEEPGTEGGDGAP